MARIEGANPALAREMKHCGTTIPADTVSKALARGHKSVSCSICKVDIPIFDPARVQEFDRREEIGKLRQENVVRASRPPLQREGYAVFVRLCELSGDTPADQYADWIEVLDREFWKIREDAANFFPNPNGGALFLEEVDGALLGADRIIRRLTSLGVSASAGVALGAFRPDHGSGKLECLGGPAERGGAIGLLRGRAGICAGEAEGEGRCRRRRGRIPESIWAGGDMHG